MTQPYIEQLRRDWFARRIPPGQHKAAMEILQAWHDAEKHRELGVWYGSCFCCCEACPPDGEP